VAFGSFDVTNGKVAITDGKQGFVETLAVPENATNADSIHSTDTTMALRQHSQVPKPRKSCLRWFLRISDLKQKAPLIGGFLLYNRVGGVNCN